MPRPRSLMFAAIFALVACTAEVRAQGVDPSVLTLERIYASGEFGAEGFDGQWLAGSNGYTQISAASNGGRGRALRLINAASGAGEVLVRPELLIPAGTNAPLNVEEYTFSNDRSKVLLFTNSKRVWRVNSRGDFWVLDRASRELFKLGARLPASSLGHAKFAPDGLKVAYVSGPDLFVEDLRSHVIKQMTRGSVDEINGSFDWVYEEEFSLRDGFRWSPDSNAIAYWQLNMTGVREVPLVNNTASLYPKLTLIRYPKVGEQNPAARVLVAKITGNSKRPVGLPGDPREHYVASLEWIQSEQGPRLALQQLNRLQNRVTLFRSEPIVTSSDVSTQAAAERPIQVEPLFTDGDDAWVDLQDKIYWLKNQTEFLWLSERGGWRQIFLVNANGQARPITAAGFDVMAIDDVDESSGLVYYTASPENATQRYLFSTKLDGSTPTGQRITPVSESGTHDYKISPDHQWAIHRFSDINTPPTIDLIRLPSHERVRLLADNQALKDKLAKLKLAPIAFRKVTLDDGAVLDAWQIVPADFDPKADRRHPLLVHVYGEPASQSVLDVWTGGNVLWHRMLAQQGYVIVSIDNRGTPAAKGRAWRKAVYRKVGILAPQDQAAAVQQVLKTTPALDPARVGVWGWSGGGSMTLNALFKYPDLYKVGIAIASVPNQRLYDTIYQERYMGLPGSNVDGFVQGSPINFAHQLKGKLLLVHGTGDDNCHYQGAEALIDELIRHDKQFSLMSYPNRSHSIHEGANTTMHLRKMMTQFLYDNLPAHAATK